MSMYMYMYIYEYAYVLISYPYVSHVIEKAQTQASQKLQTQATPQPSLGCAILCDDALTLHDSVSRQAVLPVRRAYVTLKSTWRPNRTGRVGGVGGGGGAWHARYPPPCNILPSSARDSSGSTTGS